MVNACWLCQIYRKEAPFLFILTKLKIEVDLVELNLFGFNLI